MQFLVVFDEPYDRMVRKIRSAPALRVFSVLPRYLSFTEFRQLRQADLVEQLDISSGAASRALVELARLGAIERKGTGPTTQWRLSMEWGWRGNPASYHKAKRERVEEKKPRLRVVVSNSGSPPAA